MITVDNQSVAGILSGHEVLKQEKLRPNCRRITDYIQKLLEHGRTLPHWASDPVIWVPREFNNKADSICNKVMDNRAPHVYSHKDIRAIMGTKYNIKIATDGGVRGQRISGTGWAVYAVQIDSMGEEKRQVIILEGGQFKDRGMSSLEAEILAVEEALSVVVARL